MSIFLVNQDNPCAQSLMIKLAEQAKPGAIIPLTDGEIELYCSPDFKEIITDRDNSPIKISEMEKGHHYVAVVDAARVNIDDIIKTGERLGINISIIRTQ